MSGLLRAAGIGDLERVQRLVAEGADVKETYMYGFTPFLQATCQGDIPMMHWLLTEGGSSLVKQTQYRMSALLLAAYAGKLQR
jgi:ankyrin repeat protein